MRLMPIIILITMNTPAHAGVIEYTDMKAWQNAVPSYSTIDFTGFPDGLAITDQYAAEHGLTFAPGSFFFHSSMYSNDGEGVFSPSGSSRFYFNEPRHFVAVEFVGSIVFDLYYEGELIYTSNEFFDFISPFAGLVSDIPYDEVRVYKNANPGAIGFDDLHFGTIPSPGGLALLGLAALGARARRRRACQAVSRSPSRTTGRAG